MADDLLLGIESSCDETAAAVVSGGRVIRSNVIASQVDLHRQYGGVVPEIASRMHTEVILQVVDEALLKAGVTLSDLDAISVTYGPGLVGALLTGVSYAKALAYAADLPLVPVHHLAGHIAANYLAHHDLEPPFLALVVSGAHSHLVSVRDYTDLHVIGRTRDDAPGEAFDKIARVLGLGYPGGPIIDRTARTGDPNAFKLPQTEFPDSYDFSFSGVKTATINRLNSIRQRAEQSDMDWTDLVSLDDFSATFQSAVVQALVRQTRRALIDQSFHTLVLAGGVSANSLLRRSMSDLADELGIRLFFPPPALCTDNAAMIASAGYYAFLQGERAEFTLNARAMVELGS